MTTPRTLERANLDPGTAPGDDFYRHANGGWLDANPVPPEYGSWGAFREVQVRNETLLHDLLIEAADGDEAPGTPARMVGDYYLSGMDVDEIERASIDPIAPWLEQAAAIDSRDDLLSLVTELRPYGVGALFAASVGADFEDSTRYLVYLGQSGLGLPERDYYFRDDERSVELRTAYEAHVAAMLELAGDGDRAPALATAVVAAETAIAAASLSATELRDVERTTNKTAVERCARIAPGLGLSSYLDGIGAGDEAAVNLHEPDYFAAVDRIIEEHPIETWRAYVRWHVLRAAAPALPSRFEDEAFRFYGQRLGGLREQKPRWKRVLAAATADIGQQVSRLYVDAAFGPEAKERCETMVSHLLEAMEQSIRTLEWMGAETKAEALAKLEGFRTKIGYPDEWRDYTGLEIDRGPFVGNRLRAARFDFRRRIAKLGETVVSEWELPPHVVNAYYHPLHNEIVFPAGILQPPFFDAEADDSVNYGAIGSVIGHEITHGFDDQGSKFDAAGNLRNWWTEEDRAEFERRAAGLVDQYNGFVVADDLQVNGELTLGENIADLGGLAIAFDALRRAGDGSDTVDGWTRDERFFLSYATIWRTNYTDEYLRLLVTTDPHSPGRFRCNGPLANFPPFAEAFAIDGEALMTVPPEEIVDIW